MNTVDNTTGMDPTVKAKLQEACDRVARSEKISQEERKAAAARIDQMREENAKILGIQEVAVDLVRQSRDSR
ncbi:MAG: hypothetical protein ABI614_14150 [Planctomycetota bacterium]